MKIKNEKSIIYKSPTADLTYWVAATEEVNGFAVWKGQYRMNRYDRLGVVTFLADRDKAIETAVKLVLGVE